MPFVNQEGAGADEPRKWETSVAKADAAFQAAMLAAGFKLVTITEPQTQHARVVRGEPVMITNGGSPASQCAELGGKAGGGRHTSYRDGAC